MKQQNPIILDLTKSTGFQFTEINKVKPITKLVKSKASSKKAVKARIKAKQIAKFIYDDNDNIILNPNWPGK